MVIKVRETMFLLRSSPAVHFENCIKILDKQNRLISPKCNVLQRRMARVYQECMQRALPCRMLVLKPRQVGCSTFAAEILYHHCRNYSTRAVQIADDMGNSDNIFRIFCRHAKYDVFPWKSQFSFTRTQGVFTNGSFLEKDTAQNSRAGISATRQAIHASEVAKWAITGARAASDVMGAMLNSLADVPKSVAIAESTPKGASGWFYEQWRGGVGLDEFLEGKCGNGWVKVFAAWFEFKEHQRETFGVDKTVLEDREQRGQRLYGWSMEQIAWRRSIKQSKCSGSDRLFDEYYPEDDVTCFLSSGSPRFDVEKVLELEALTQKYTPKQGCLREKGEEIVLEQTLTDEAWAQVWEMPKEGCRYLIAADLSVSEDQSTSEEGNPDRHSVLVLCEGYLDDDGVEHPAMLVARVKPPTRVGFDVLARQADFLSRFYGRCLVVPEMNNSGMAFIERLKERRVPLYVRRKVSASTRNIVQLKGWQTTEQNRKLIIDELAAKIRKEEISIFCSHVIGELKTFVTNSVGREEALTGCHDDDVLALAIGLHCLSSGSIYRSACRTLAEPKDSYEKKSEPLAFGGKW